MTTNIKIPISIVVPVRNEERNLPRCLAALREFDEVIVVDSSSIDQTASIARASGAQLVNFEWNGSYPKKRNWFLQNHTLKNEWVLFVDADEVISPEFCIAAANAIEQTEHSGFWISYTNYFLGKKLRFGVPQRKLAMFRVGKGLYERIEETSWSKLDMEIHEHPLIDGSCGVISAPIEHKDYRGVLKFLDRHREYAVWEVGRYTLLVTGKPEAWDALTPRQKQKYTYLTRPWYPFAYFLYQYGLKLGILDGYAGLQYALYKFWYFNTIGLLCRESVKESADVDASRRSPTS